MSKLDPRIEAIRVKYDLEPTDFWELPQKKGTWVAKHSALEVAAFKAGIHFNAPQIIEANTTEGIAVLAVEGHVATMEGVLNSPVRREWATGEASPKNNKNAYPWAMAEKRAKDRVILKLIGIHGLVYSEDELSEPAAERSSEPRVAPNTSPPLLQDRVEKGGSLTVRLSEADPGASTMNARIVKELEVAASQGLAALGKSWLAAMPDIKRLPEKWELDLVDMKDVLKAKIGAEAK